MPNFRDHDQQLTIFRQPVPGTRYVPYALRERYRGQDPEVGYAPVRMSGTHTREAVDLFHHCQR